MPRDRHEDFQKELNCCAKNSYEVRCLLSHIAPTYRRAITLGTTLGERLYRPGSPRRRHRQANSCFSGLTRVANCLWLRRDLYLRDGAPNVGDQIIDLLIAEKAVPLVHRCQLSALSDRDF